jgi:hypothetical protein
MMTTLRQIGVLCAGVMLTGCALVPKTLNVSTPTADNPAEGPDVAIVRVTDRRDFLENPGWPSSHSAKSETLSRPGVTEQVIARKQGSSGVTVYAEVRLPEGRTVPQVVEEVLVRSLRENGYRVLSAGMPGSEDAVPLEVEVHRFWLWHDEVSRFQSRIAVRGPLEPFVGGLVISGESQGGGSWARWMRMTTSSGFKKTLKLGLDDLEANIGRSLAKARARVDRRGARPTPETPVDRGS